jgi:RNA-binding protein Nova
MASTPTEGRKRPLEETGPTADGGGSPVVTGSDAKLTKPNTAEEKAAAEQDKKTEESSGAAGAAPDAGKAAVKAALEETPASKAAFPTSYALKVLVSNNSAGCIIGTRGSTIRTMQQQSSATIKLSQNGEYFPHLTGDRVVLISSPDMQPVLTAVSLVLQKVSDELPPEAMGRIEGKFPVPTGAVPSIEGKGGANTVAIMAENSTVVSFAAEAAGSLELGERILTISGSLEGIIGSVANVLGKMKDAPAPTPREFQQRSSEDGRMYANMSTNYKQYMASQGLGPAQGMGGMGPGMGGMIGVGGGRAEPTRPQKVMLQIPDLMVGAIVGRGGSVINELMNQGQCRIQVSQKGEYIPGTRNRSVTVSGDVPSVGHFTSNSQSRLARTRAVLFSVGGCTSGTDCGFLVTGGPVRGRAD